MWSPKINTAKRILINLIVTGLLVTGILSFPLHKSQAEGFPPTVVLGLYGTALSYGQNSGSSDTLGGVELGGLLGWRTPAFDGGYFSLNSSTSIYYYFYGIEEIDDFEKAFTKLAIPVNNNRIKISGGLDF